MKGYVQVYTGNGKGKTTAAFGQALRAAGAGLRVFIAQFVKGMEYSEHKAIERFSDLITLKQYGRDCFINKEPTDKDIYAAKQGYDDVAEIIRSGDYQMLIRWYWKKRILSQKCLKSDITIITALQHERALKNDLTLKITTIAMIVKSNMKVGDMRDVSAAVVIKQPPLLPPPLLSPPSLSPPPLSQPTVSDSQAQWKTALCVSKNSRTHGKT